MTGVYDRILSRLDSLDMSESDLARAVNESPQTLHNWKQRGAVPAGKLLSVATVLRVSTDWLLGAEDKNPQMEDLVGEDTAGPPMALGRRVKECLDELGWKSVELLERVPDLSAQTLSALIRRDSMTSEHVFKIARALGANPEYLQDGVGPKWLAKTAQTDAGRERPLRLDALLRQLYTYPPEVIQAALAEIGLQPPAPPADPPAPSMADDAPQAPP